MKISQRHFLKQYTCYQLSDAMKGKYTPQQTLKLSFTGSTQSVYHDLKHQIIDGLSSSEKLYICKWQITTSNSTYLDLFQFNSDLCFRIQMSSKPLFVNIAQQYLYIIGGNSLYVISLNRLQLVASYVLGSQKVHAVQVGFSQTDSTLCGVCVYSWNDKKGYRKRFYNAANGTQDKWWSNLSSTILLKKAPKQLLNSTLKIVIPGVLGLLILPNQQQICLINLGTMQIMDNSTCKLSGWTINKAHRAVVKYHINKKSSGFDDSLLITIGEKQQQMLQVYIFHIKYTSFIKQKYLQQNNTNTLPSITSFTSGEVLDDLLCKLQTYVSYSTQGSLITYLLTQTGIIYLSNTPARIPIANFVYYNNPQNINPILTLEHKICEAHLEDVQIINEIEENKKEKDNSNVIYNYYEDQLTQNYIKKLVNSILRPNRYSIPFIQLSIGEEPIAQIKISKINPNKLLFDWYKLNKIKNIQVFNGDITIFRQNSMTSLLPIPQEQYQNQYQNGQKLLQFFLANPQFEGRNSMSNYNISINSEGYEQKVPFQSILWKENIWDNRGREEQISFTYEKVGQSYKQVKQNLKRSMQMSRSYIQNEKKKSTLYGQTYQKFITYFLSHINKNNLQQLPALVQTPIQQQSLITNKSLLISKQLIINRVKDILCFYTKILKYLYLKRQTCAHPNSYLTSYSKIQKLLIKYISFINNLLQQSYYQVSAHSIDLVEMYIIQEFIKLQQQIDKNQRRNNEIENEVKANNNINIIINVEQQSWKIIGNIFEDIIIDSKQLFDNKGIKLNSFIRMLFNNIKAGFQYISTYLQNTFVPYSPYYYIFEQNNNYNNSQTYNSVRKLACISNQQCHFPQTPTLLNIYCYFPSNTDIQNRLINSYILQRIINKMDEKTVNKLINGLVASRNYKDLIKNIYHDINDNKYNNQDLLTATKTEKSKTTYRNSNSNQYGTTNQNNMQEQYEEDQIDNTRGIINLAKVLDPQVLQKHLDKLNDQNLQAIFRVNVQAALKISIDQFSNMNQRNNFGMQNKQYTNQDIVVGWIFKYRAYAKKIRRIINKMHKNIQTKKDQGHSSQHLKTTFNKYVFNCLHSLQNVKNYYNNLYKINNNEVANRKQTQVLSDEQIIQKVCCRMVGFDSTSDLYLYPVLLEGIQFNQECPHQILPTSQFLKWLQKMLNDPNTSVQTVSNLHSIAIYYLMIVLQNPYTHINTFRQLGKYYSRRQLSKLIIQNSILKNRFEALGKDQACLQIKGYFGYNQLLDLTSGNNLYKSHMRTAEKHGSMKISKAGSKKSLGASSSNFGNQPSENIYEILPFRNAYLQALGR